MGAGRPCRLPPAALGFLTGRVEATGPWGPHSLLLPPVTSEVSRGDEGRGACPQLAGRHGSAQGRSRRLPPATVRALPAHLLISGPRPRGR